MRWKIQKTCIFALEICFKENIAFFFFPSPGHSSLACEDVGEGVCVFVCVLGFLALWFYQYRFSFRTDGRNGFCFLLMRNRSCPTGICKYNSMQSSPFTVFSQKKVMGKKKSF